MIRIFLCGTGHGATSLVNGSLLLKGLDFRIVTSDQSIAKLGADKKLNVYEKIPYHILNKDDLVITSSYKPIITNQNLNKARFLNIHYALLPKYRGMHPIVWSIINGESEVGYSIHQTTDIVDGGPIYFQRSIKVASYDSWQLMLMIDKLVEKNMPIFLNDFLLGKLKSKIQNESEAICVAPRNNDDCKVNWSEWNCILFPRYLKALVPPYPRPFFIYKGQKCELLDCEVRKINYFEINGHVVHVSNESVGVKVSDGIVFFRYFLINNEKVKANSFLPKIGIRL